MEPRYAFAIFAAYYFVYHGFARWTVRLSREFGSDDPEPGMGIRRSLMQISLILNFDLPRSDQPKRLKAIVWVSRILLFGAPFVLAALMITIFR